MGSFHGEVVFQSRKFQVVRKEVAGSLEPVRYVVHHPGAVAILPVLDDGRLVLIRNYRAALDTKLLEIPAGTCEPGESAEAAAVRELEEETGYQAHVWQRLCQFYTSPGISDEKMTLFLARSLSPGRRRLAPDEQLEPCVLSFEEALAAVNQNVIRDAKSLVAILLYKNMIRL